jgi:type II secretory pathway pseudopilin PulG
MPQMLPTVSRGKHSEGFSLVEALLALGIAAMLASALTHAISNSRMNAGMVREQVEMMTLGDSLLEQGSWQNPEPSYGRGAGFAWRMTAAPIDFTAVAERMNVPATAPSEIRTTSIKASSGNEPVVAPKKAASWVPFHVSVVVESPSGRKYVTDSITLGLVPNDK